MTHQFDTSDYIIVPDDHPRLTDKDSIETVKREAYNQAINDAAAICKNASCIGFNFSDYAALREKIALECYEEIKELKK